MHYYKRISSISTAKKKEKSFQNFVRYKEKGLKEHNDRERDDTEQVLGEPVVSRHIACHMAPSTKDKFCSKSPFHLPKLLCCLMSSGPFSLHASPTPSYLTFIVISRSYLTF